MYRNYFIYIFLLIHPFVHSTDVGSDFAVTLFNNQVPLVNADRIAGFAALNGGFFLYDTTTTVLFDSFFSVAGSIELNGATLNLNQDLVLQDVADIVSLGTINANFHQLEFAPGMSVVPSARAQMGCLITSTTSTTSTAQVNEVTWSPDSQYVAIGRNDPGGTGTQLLVYQWNGTALIFRGGVDVNAAVNSVSWHPTNDWIAAGRATAAGSELYIYSFNRTTGALTLLSSVDIANTVNSVAWHPAGGHIALGSNNNAIRVRVYVVSGAGALGASVTVDPGADANAVDWSMTGTYLAVGTDAVIGVNELQVYTFNSGALTLTLNSGDNVANQVNSVAWNTIAGNEDLVAVGVNAGTDRVRVYRHNGGAGTLTFLDGDIATIIVNFVHWNPFSGCLAACLNSSAAGEIRIFTFSNNTITQTDSEDVGAFNVLGGRWSNDGNYFGSGSSAPAINIYRFDPTLFNTSNIFSNIKLFLNSDITMQDCRITFTGNNLIGGRSNCLTLLSTATLAVAANSSVLFQDIRIEGIRAGSIIPLDNTSTLSFQNCTFVMDGDYTFSLGRFDVVRGFNLEGRNKSFIYTSNQKSRILQKGNMLIDTDVTFSYVPSNNSNALLELNHANATLSLNSGTIATSLAGLRLTKGKLSIDGKSFLRNDATTKAQGIFWGDGSSSASNLQLEWQPAATLQLMSGFLINDNV